MDSRYDNWISKEASCLDKNEKLWRYILRSVFNLFCPTRVGCRTLRSSRSGEKSYFIEFKTQYQPAPSKS